MQQSSVPVHPIMRPLRTLAAMPDHCCKSWLRLSWTISGQLEYRQFNL